MLPAWALTSEVNTQRERERAGMLTMWDLLGGRGCGLGVRGALAGLRGQVAADQK